jgi:DNA repair exonuclease SbcCD ATPase subunit
MDEQFVDFTELEKSGLFLICGETGSGKTTILDAMCYALYGASSGGKRGELSAMRCKLAQPKDETFVEFIFDCGGKRYKFTRSMKLSRKNINEYHNCLVLRDGVFEPIFENPKMREVNRQAQRIIGLSYEQFRQVIILPQGQFENLLLAKSEEKEQILVSLFHADRWQRIVAAVQRRVNDADSRICQQRQLADAKLNEYACKNLEELKLLLVESDQIAQQAQLAAQRNALELEQLQNQYQAALLDSQEHERLLAAQKRLEALRRKKAAIELERNLLTTADRAELLLPACRDFEESKNLLQKANSLLQSRQKQDTDARAAWERAKKAQMGHEALREEFEHKKQRILVLKNAADCYTELSRQSAALKQAQMAMNTEEQTMNGRKNTYDRTDSAWKNAIVERERADDEFRRIQGAYLDGIGSVLARRLSPDVPCPVCGSTHHPDPAKPARNHVTEAQYNQYSEYVTRCTAAVSDAHSKWVAAGAAYNDAQRLFETARQNAAVEQAKFEALQARKIPGIENTTQLNNQTAELEKAVCEYSLAEEKILQGLTAAEGACRSAKQNLLDAEEAAVQAKQSFDQLQSVWNQALLEAGFADEYAYRAACIPAQARQQRQQEVAKFDADLLCAEEELEQLQERLAGKAAPDIKILQQAVDAARKADSEANRHLALQQQKYGQMNRDHAMLEKKIAELDEQRIQVDEDLEFVKRLTGRTGISLQRYVLGVMLSAITQEANRLLGNVYGGRYRLYRTDEKVGSSQKSGLELEVFDNFHQSRRSVATLSGGEKFLVALSLAIGLSTVVQAQGSGIRLEAMFVDEGFGSLDRDSITDALDVLQGIRRGNGVVGIISHVEQLAETIPTKLMVTKSKNGSTLSVKR